MFCLDSSLLLISQAGGYLSISMQEDELSFEREMSEHTSSTFEAHVE